MPKNLLPTICLIGCSFTSSLLAFTSPVKANTEVIYERLKPSNEVPSQIINLIVDDQGNEGIEVPTTSPNSNFNVTLPQAPVITPPPAVAVGCINFSEKLVEVNV